MRERPILFSGQMVVAIQDGKKTQTRRVVKRIPDAVSVAVVAEDASCEFFSRTSSHIALAQWINCPHGKVGDRLWVRETWSVCAWGGSSDYIGIRYHADNATRVFSNKHHGMLDAWTKHGMKTRPSIHMPRWASRITLEITDVRVQRVQEISEADAIAEGVERLDGQLGGLGDYLASKTVRYKPAFSALWDNTYGERDDFGWDTNPWVWAISFTRVD